MPAVHGSCIRSGCLSWAKATVRPQSIPCQPYTEPTSSHIRGVQITHRMCSRPSHRSIPPFTRRKIWTVNLKLLLRRIPFRHRFQSAHITSMSEFTLRITSDNVVIEDLGHPVGFLFFRCLLSYRCDYSRQHGIHSTWNARKQKMLTKHSHMQMKRAHLISQIFRHLIILHIPSFLPPNSLDRLGSRKAKMISLRPTQVHLLILFEEFLFAQNIHYLLLSFKEPITREEVLGELVDVDGRRIALCLQSCSAVVSRLQFVCEVWHYGLEIHVVPEKVEWRFGERCLGPLRIQYSCGRSCCSVDFYVASDICRYR